MQAVTGDIANGATVSLIETDTGKTVSTAVSSADGMFNIAFPSSFVPEVSKPYVLEAVKGLAVGGSANRAGAAAARVRTLVASQGGSWQSLSGGGIVIGRATTALCIIGGHRNLGTTDQLNLLGKLSGTAFASAGTPIAADEFETVSGLVTGALAEDQDPVEAVGYFAGGSTAALRYGRKSGSLIIHDAVSPPIPARGATVTLAGQNLPGPGPATPSLFIGDAAVTTWSIDASRSALTLTVPAGAMSGYLRVVQGSATWYGPMVPVRGTVGTFAGRGKAGHRDGPPDKALFESQPGSTRAPSGAIYVSDAHNSLLRMISPKGEVSTLIPNLRPFGGAFDSAGNFYFCDSDNHRIQKLARDGRISTFAGDGTAGWVDGASGSARFDGPSALAIDSADNVFVSEWNNNRIRKVTPQGEVSTIAGSGARGFADGPAASAAFNRVTGIAVDRSGNAYVADCYNHRIRMIANGEVTTVAGSGAGAFSDGDALSAQFNTPVDVAVGQDGTLYVADQLNRRIRKIAGGTVSTLAGSGSDGYVDGLAAEARFSGPNGVEVMPNGSILVNDAANSAVRIVSPP